MEKSKSTIKIEAKPFVTIAVILSLFVLTGFIFDSSQTKEKLEDLSQHIERVKNAHSEDFQKIANFTDPTQSLNLLRQINSPEQGVYEISVLKKENDNWRIINGRYIYPSGENFILSEAQIKKIKNDLSNQTAFTTQEDIFGNSSRDKNNLYAFSPIFENGKLIGYAIIKLQKTKNI